MNKRLIVILLSLTMGCGYHFQGNETESGSISISVPYIKGDVEGQLNQEIVRAVSMDPRFEYRQNGGALILVVAIISDGDDRIGYRYDRTPTTGKRRKNIVATENRRTITAEVKLIEAYSDEVLAGPVRVSATADYDYVDANSVRDLTFEPPHGKAQTIIDFSLGQLDSIEGAHDDAGSPIYKLLAQKIANGLANQDW